MSPPQNSNRPYDHRLTYLETALKERLHEQRVPVVTTYGLFLELRALYHSGRELYLRKALPDTEELATRREHLLAANALTHDPDYPHSVYRVADNSRGETEEVTCLVDPFCCIAYLSAMARYGLTSRRPKAVHLKSPDKKIRRSWVEERMAQDYGEELPELSENQVIWLRKISHPYTVRQRPVQERNTRYIGGMAAIRDGYARITTIGQTFVDMLEHPGACGGMAHVLEVWDEHADLYIDQIVEAVDQHPRPIIKVRAGYLLDERLGIALDDKRIQAWTRYAQRGGSQILDPKATFSPEHSEKWMLSLNVG